MDAVIEHEVRSASRHTWIAQYCLLRLLRDGGMAKVYLAYDTNRRHLVVLKMVDSTQFDERQFSGEVRAMERLAHAHILPLLDTGRRGKWQYLVMPYISGGTLQDRLDKQALTFDDVSLLVEQLADAVHYMHTRGVIHRDIKPENILLNGNTVYLADFGLATFLGEEPLLLNGLIMGTPLYMAPELSEGLVSRQSDLYAVGVVLYQMLTGELPFDGESVLAVCWKHRKMPPPRPSRLNPSLSLAMERLILRALEKKPQHRFRTARAFAQAYRKALTSPGMLEQMHTTIMTLFQSLRMPQFCGASRL